EAVGFEAVCLETVRPQAVGLEAVAHAGVAAARVTDISRGNLRSTLRGFALARGAYTCRGRLLGAKTLRRHDCAPRTGPARREVDAGRRHQDHRSAAMAPPTQITVRSLRARLFCSFMRSLPEKGTARDARRAVS